MGCPPCLTLDFTRAMCSSTVVRPTYQIRTSIPSASAFSRSPVIVLPPRVVSNAKIKFLDNSAFEQALAFLPGGAVRFHLRDTRIPRGDLSRGDVRVEIFHSVRQEHRSGDAAFSSAIGSRQHVNPWNPRHACAPLLPQPFPIVPARP